MCITMRVAWLTIDRLRSGRDIRLSAATMRALNSRRLRSTTGIHGRLVSRTALSCILLLCVFSDARARSVSHDDEGIVVADQADDGISESAEVSDSVPYDANGATRKDAEQERRRSLTLEGYDKDDSGEERRNPAEEIPIQDSEKIQIEATNDESSVAKKRRRNDVILPGKLALQNGESVAQNVEENERIKDEGIRRFDAQIETDDTEVPDQRRISDDIVENISDSQMDDTEHDGQRSSVVEQSPADVEDPNDEDRAEPEGETYTEISTDLRGNLENVANSNQEEKVDLNKEETGQIENLAKYNLDEAQVDTSDEVRNELRSMQLAHADESESDQEKHVTDAASNNEEIGVEDLDPNRENRHLTDNAGKPKYKSSTVYLNAEEGNLPGREQESIVNGQIKKLISIRDDAIETVNNDAKQSEKFDEESLLSVKSIDVDVVEKDEGARNQRSNDEKDAPIQGETLDRLSSTTEVSPNRFQKWRDQAALLQEQIKNSTFLHYLREQTIEVLPGIPIFTEYQLLDILKSNRLLRKSPSNETYLANLNATDLSENQLEIIKCAEQLVETKQRQTFVQNMAECIRGLNVLNCMRIFVWPVILDNLPESIKQTMNNLPIEISLIDLFQSNRTKSARSDGNVHRARLLTPESVVFDILKGALESKATFEQAPNYIDPSNETLRTLLTIGQLQILQMAERLLPGEARREYSDRMFSCVRRFEYFSCVKYFAWPMVKQYYPALPAFPDYQSWYPTIALYPQYPIVPFPSFVETTGELPEVVEADATRMRRPKPEAVIVDILRNTLKEHAKVPPPSVAHSTDSYIALLPPDQLLSIRMAEQLLPVPYRPEFVQKTVKCMQEYNYMTCIRYSTWPTVRQFTPSLPSLPDLSGWIPNWQFPDVFSYVPGFQLPSIPDFSSLIPGLGSGGGTAPPTTEPPPVQTGDPTPEEPSGRFPTILLRQQESTIQTSGELENKITDILTRVQHSLKAVPENSHLIVSGNVIILTIDEKQINIMRLAESIVPPPARASLVGQVLSCLQMNNDFLNCTRYIIWPTVALYVPNFPAFPDLSPIGQPSKQENQTLLKDKNVSQQSLKDQQKWDKSQNEENSNIKIISRTKFQQNNGPVISVTGTRFVPIFTEHPESVILNILRSIQLSSPNVRDGDDVGRITASAERFGNLLNDRQLNILRITEGLLPDAARPAFIERMAQCIRKNNFLLCSRSVLWPTLSERFPRLPSFPNFGGHPQASSNKFALQENLTDPSPFSETDVKIGQHGDATVTITDTRFYPVFSEHPEGIILRILIAVQNSVPGVLASSITSRTPDITTYLTEQQVNIVQVAESLLPETVRPIFAERMAACVRKSMFLECTRDILWPTVAQFFPRLPNFPNFGSYQTLPRMKLDLSSILLRNAYSENQSNEKNRDIPEIALETIEDKVESVLKDLPSKDSTTRTGNSYLDIDNPAIGTLLTAREMNIVKLTERAIPDTLRRSYIINMLECVRRNNFMTCTQQVSWPTLKQFSPSLPSFEELLGQFPIPGGGQIPIPGIGQLPEFPGQIPSLPGTGNPFAEGPSIPSIPSFPPQIPMLPGGIPQFPGFPSFPGGINFPQFGILSDAPRQEPKPKQEQTIQSTVAEAENQISGVSRAANTASVDEQGIVPGYLGQPSHILIDISKERVHLSDIERQSATLKSVPADASSAKHERKRRSADQLINSYYEIDGKVEQISEATVDNTFPNITESEFLQLLIHVSNSQKDTEPVESQKEYLADILNSTITNSLTADQRKILEIVEDLSQRGSIRRGFLSRVIRCVTRLNFMRCMGIFVWPLITSTVPSLLGISSLGLPALALGILARSADTEADYFLHFFGMSTNDFEKELLARKESVESTLLDWYKRAMEEKFQTNVGFLKIKGYGNGELGVSFGGSREGRATKIKDNKNLPSILTIISDIMEEVLDQRPDSEKVRNKEKRERSLDDVQETNFQLLKENDETDIKRSVNDDQIINMFLDKIKANASDFADGDVAQFLNVEDAHNAFSVLFGTRLNEKFANRLKAFTEEHLKKDRSEDAKETKTDELKVIPLKEEVAYERGSTENHEERKREHRAKNDFRSLLDEYSNRFVKRVSTERIEDPDNENKIKDTESLYDKNSRSELRIRLPILREDIISRKGTNAIMHIGRTLKTKMSNLMPGIGFIITFFIQMALAHARAAATMAGMISNMAFASALFAMLRQSLLGSDNPQVKYVYDNDKTGPGITWPHHHRSYYHGK